MVNTVFCVTVAVIIWFVPSWTPKSGVAVHSNEYGFPFPSIKSVWVEPKVISSPKQAGLGVAVASTLGAIITVLLTWFSVAVSLPEESLAE